MEPTANASFAPAFIFGVPRSGTTLLVNLLGSHPLIAPLYETRFIRNLVRLCRRAGWLGPSSFSRRIARLPGSQIIEKQFLKECENFRRKVIAYHKAPASKSILYTADELTRETDLWLHSLRMRPFSNDEIYGSARNFVDHLFAIHCQRLSKPYWINKTPGLLNHIDGLARLYPGAKCIHIIRDGRDVAVSNLHQKWGPNNIYEAARRWKELMLEGRKGLARNNVRFIEIRYENLIRAPVDTLRRLFDFLNVEGDPKAILSHVKVHDRSIGSWSTAFSVKDRRIFARTAGNLLIDLGYEKDSRWTT
jgi:sulfotransferase family protein